MNKRIYLKKIIFLLFFISLTLPAFSSPIIENPIQNGDIKPIELSVSFDWISKSQMQRDENIAQIKNILFNDDTILKYKKNEFKDKNKAFWRDKNYLKNYEDIMNGKKEDSEKNYCGFYLGKLLIAYGIQYKNDMKNIYYYDAMGHLRWIDVFSSQYPNFPYWSYQYYRSGELVAAYYYVSDVDQYVFDEKKKFRGRWYKDKMYNRNAKVIMTRSNY